MNYQAFQEAFVMAPLVPLNITAVDTSCAAIVQYVPALGTGGAAATCAVATATGLTFQVDAANPAGLDAIGSAAGVVLWTTHGASTAGGIADYVNSKAAWRMILRGALRADSPISKWLTITAASCIGDNGMKLLHDTSTALVVSEAISGERFVNNGIGGHLRDAEDMCINHLMYGAYTITFGAGTGVVTYYTESQTATGAQIGGSTSLTTATKTEHQCDSLTLPYVSSRPGERLICRITVTSSTAASPTMNLVGKTQVLSGKHIVTTYST